MPNRTPRRGGADKTVATVTAIEENRVKRRKQMRESKLKRQADKRSFEERGTPGDVDFQNMIVRWLATQPRAARPHRCVAAKEMSVYLRLRPVNEKERSRRQFEAMAVINPAVYVLECKFKVCGISKYVQAHEFNFDQSFGPDEDSEEVYKYTTRPLVDFVVNSGGLATCFAYGQTGSGKTYTLTATQRLASEDIFEQVRESGMEAAGVRVFISYYEVFGSKVSDLLHTQGEDDGRKRMLAIRESAGGRVNVVGLEEDCCSTADELFERMAHGNGNRRTEATSVHNLSSRSHAVCTITLRDTTRKNKRLGRLLLIDLAGSERASETKDSSKERRAEGAEINKSLLALKECIRKLETARKNARGRELTADKVHVPYRASKLTMVLKDAFAPDARTAMICCISPTQADQNHTLNTLRYADKIKRRLKGGFDDEGDEPLSASSAGGASASSKTPSVRRKSGAKRAGAQASSDTGTGGARGSPARGGRASSGSARTPTRTSATSRGARVSQTTGSLAASRMSSKQKTAQRAARGELSPGARARAKAPKVKVRGTRAMAARVAAAKGVPVQSASAARAVVKAAAGAKQHQMVGSSSRGSGSGSGSGAVSSMTAASSSGVTGSGSGSSEPSSLEAALSTLAMISAAARDAASAAEGRIAISASGVASTPPRNTGRSARSGNTPGSAGRRKTTTPTRGKGKPLSSPGGSTAPRGGLKRSPVEYSARSPAANRRTAASSPSIENRIAAGRGKIVSPFATTRRLEPPSMAKALPPQPPKNGAEQISPTATILREASQLAREGKVTQVKRGGERDFSAQHTLLAQPTVVRLPRESSVSSTLSLSHPAPCETSRRPVRSLRVEALSRGLPSTNFFSSIQDYILTSLHAFFPLLPPSLPFVAVRRA